MKFTKMSLVAALLIGSSAFALDNVKMSGNVQVMYNTTDANNGDFFHEDASAADIGVNLNASADLAKNDVVTLSAGVGYTALGTLGLENSLVGSVWGGAHTAVAGTGSTYGSALGGAKVENASWINEAYAVVALNQGSKSLLKIGRQDLDTPLAFTETWSIEKNTFEAAVLVNQDLPDTTVVLAYVGNGNGNEPFGQDLSSNVAALGLAVGGVVNGDGDFGTFGTNSAYAAGVVNNSFKPVTAQAWYYNLQSLATAFWVQADLSMEGVLAGIQYTSTTVGDGDASGTIAGMVGYEMADMLTAKVAFSQTSDKGALHGANTATGTSASKLYTEAWWAYGAVTMIDTSAINVTVESPVNGIVDLGLYVTSTDAAADNSDLLEVAVTAGKTFGPLDATVAYVYDDVDGDDDAVSSIQAYLTLNF
jgi:imipenem/basic amino acid-specific outer membrane pore